MMPSHIFAYPFLIKECHLDTFSHVNNATYLSILEEARWELITRNGFGLKKIQETGLGPTILEIQLVFLRELRLRDEVIIETELLSYENKIGKLAQRILRNNELCCKAEFTMALFDLKTRRLIPPTAEWLHAIGVTD